MKARWPRCRRQARHAPPASRRRAGPALPGARDQFLETAYCACSRTRRLCRTRPLLASLQCCFDSRYSVHMPSIGFLAQKGGAGKTTLAVHLAVLAGDALLVDLDPQRSAAEWWETRSAELPELAVGEARDLK